MHPFCVKTSNSLYLLTLLNITQKKKVKTCSNKNGEGKNKKNEEVFVWVPHDKNKFPVTEC